MVSCNKKDPRPVYNVRYEINLHTQDTISIAYQSDYWSQSGNLKVFSPHEEGTTHNINSDLVWYAERTSPNRDEGYNIQVWFDDDADQLNYFRSVRVYVNDTNLIDSYESYSDTNTIILSGEFPFTF